MSEYVGWKVPKKVIIVVRRNRKYSHSEKKYIGEGYQGYVCDPSNKDMLAQAREWAKWVEYGPRVNDKFEWTKVHTGEEYEFENDGFTLELVDCAGDSSQGGKLSFWNCNITKDGKTFLVGISSTLLLEVLKSNTFVNGVCQSKLMFGRCKGQVGMLTKNMDGYKQAQKDEEIRNKTKRNKTSKHEVGKTYVTATLSNVYLGKLYSWYDPVYTTGRNRYLRDLIGFKKRDEPKTLYIFPDYDASKTKLSDYVSCGIWGMSETKPAARCVGNETVEIDASLDCFTNYFDNLITEAADNFIKNPNQGNYINASIVGISTNEDSSTMNPEVANAIDKLGYKVFY